MTKKIIHGLIIGLLASILALGLHAAGLLNWLELKTWNIRSRLLARPADTSGQIALVMIDQGSLDWGYSENDWTWPWSREVYTAIIEFCRRGGARAVGLDIIFTESKEIIAAADQALGDCLASNRNTAVAMVTSHKQGLNSKWPDGIPMERLDVIGLDPFLSRTGGDLLAERATLPVPMIATNCHWLGHVFFTPDNDAIIRRTLLFQQFDGRFIPSLGLATYMAANPATTLKIRGSSLHVGDTRVPLDDQGRAIIRYRGGTQVYSAYNAAQVIQSELRLREGGKPPLDPSVFKDKYVFLGASAPGLLDLKPTPFSETSPGTAIHAHVLDNLLAGDFPSDASKTVLLLMILAMGVCGGIAVRLSNRVWLTIVSFAVILPLPFLAALPAYQHGLWLPVAAPLVAAASALIGALILNYALEGHQKRFIKNAFRQYLSPEVIEQLLEKPDNLQLGGESRELTIFFSDVQGFTTISEALEAGALTTLMNEYLSACTDIILDEGGTLDKYIGDAIVAFWNAPVDVPDHAIRGVRSALLCQRKLDQMRPDFLERFGKQVYSRVGVNTGTLKVGNMGSTRRFNYTFIGDAGNLASRLEGINKQFGTYVMISEFTKAKIGDKFALRELSRVTVKGRYEPVRVYEPMFKEDFAARAQVLEVFARALAEYYKGDFQQALKLFESIAEQDPPAYHYISRCQQLIEHPQKEWTGVWEITEK